MSLYNEVVGDVIQVAREMVKSNRCVVIPHVCNNHGVMGAGVAAALAKEWPVILPAYRTLCDEGSCLGFATSIRVESGIMVYNMIAQDGFGSDVRPPIRYAALATCMTKLAVGSKQYPMHIVAPRFGSGLAGGDWHVIWQLIREVWLDAGIRVTVVTYGAV